MAESISSRITRLQQLLSGRSGRKVPLVDKDALLDSMVCLYSECSSDVMMRDKNIATFIKKCKYHHPLANLNYSKEEKKASITTKDRWLFVV